MKKEIRIKYEIFTNYNAHLLGVAKIGFNSDYSKDYRHTINPEDLKFLQDNKSLLKWGNGQTNPLTNIFIFFPNYINLKSKSEISNYFNLLNDSVKSKSFDNFKKVYQSYISNLQNWSEPDLNPILFSYKIEIQKLSEIYINNYDRFVEEVWPIEKAKIQGKVQILNSRLSKLNFIELWDNFTNLKFQFNYYDIILSSGIKNGPTANSLGYEKNWFYYNNDTDWLIQFICHETGTHILINLLKQIMIDKKDNNFDEDFNIMYQAYENLCSFYNHFILKSAGLKHSYEMRDYDSVRFYKIFDRIFSKNKNISAEILYREGINEYKKNVA